MHKKSRLGVSKLDRAWGVVMRHGEHAVIVVIAGAVLGWSSLVRSSDFGAPELLEAVADTPRGSAVKLPVEVSSNQIETAFLALHRSLRIVSVSGQSGSATLSAADSFLKKLTKKQTDGLVSLADGFAQKLKSGDIKIDATEGVEPKPKLTGAAAANEDSASVEHRMPGRHMAGMPRGHMGWGMWHMNDDYHREQMGHEWWDWNSSLSRWGVSVNMSRSYFQLRCLNDDDIKETISMPGWLEAVVSKLPCPEEPTKSIGCLGGVHILWNDQYWVAK